MKKTRGEELVDKYSFKLTRWVGTPQSVVVHTMFFGGIFLLEVLGLTTDKILLILTTIVSLEAIYLSIFIQMTVNRSEANLREVEADIEEISDEIEDLGEDVSEISQDIDKIQIKDEEEEKKEIDEQVSFEKIQTGLQKLLNEIELLKNHKLK